MMAEREQRKDLKNLLDLDDPEELILTKPEPIEIASGYSISVKYATDGRPLIYVKKYGEVDTRGLRRQIERNYPGAHIQGLGRLRPVEMADNQKKRTAKPRTRRSKKSRRPNI